MTRAKPRLAFFAAGIVVLAAGYALVDSEPARVPTRAEVSFPGAPNAAPVDAPHPAAGLASIKMPAAAPPSIAELNRQLADTDPGARDLLLQESLPALFAQDPQAAARFAELQSDPALRELAIRQVALLWGASDPVRAVNWARSLTEERERDATITDIANGLSSVDPAGSVQLREQFAGQAKADSALSNLVQQWAGVDFDAALAWTEARAPGAQRDDLLQRLVYVRAASGDLTAAARLVNDAALAGDAKTAAVATVAQEWALRNPAAANEWLQTLEPDSSRAAMADLAAQAGSDP